MPETIHHPANERELLDVLLYEAELLDTRQYEKWLDLFTVHAEYMVPINEADPQDIRVSLVHDDRQRMEERVFRIVSGSAFAEDPPHRTRRLLTNIRVTALEEHSADVRSNFIIGVARRGTERLYTGHYEHEFRADDGGWKITRKVCHLLASDHALDNLTFLL